MKIGRLTSNRPWADASGDLASEPGYQWIWQRLNSIENVLGDEYDISRLAELVQADNDGRIRLLSAGRGKVCKECAHFIPIEGQKSGDCRVKEHFRASQSHSACYRFEANKVYQQGKGGEKL